MKNYALTRSFVLLLSLGCNSLEGLAATFRVLPAGDSNTAGLGNPGGTTDAQYLVGYRKHLKELLAADGIGIDFQGVQSSGTSSGLNDPQHEGYPGEGLGKIQSRVSQGMLEGLNPEVLLLMVGANDMWVSLANRSPISDDAARQRVQSLSLLLDDMINRRPLMHIIVAKPVTPGNAQQPLSIYRSGIDQLVAARRGQGRRISVIDCLGAENDGTHYTGNGHHELARRWHSAIKTAVASIPTPAPVPVPIPVPVNNAPSATTLSLTLIGDQIAPLHLQGTDLDHHKITYSLISSPTNGLLTDFNADSGFLFYTPAHGYVGVNTFSYMVRDSAGANSGTATVYLNVTPPPDGNRNGLPDDWEAMHRISHPSHDSDRDGASNLEEYRANTDPGDASSVMRIQQVARERTGAFHVLWSSVGGTRYRLQYRNGIIGKFIDIPRPISAEMDRGPKGLESAQAFRDDFTLTQPPNAEGRYYRVAAVVSGTPSAVGGLVLYRAIDFNGPATTIDGQPWEGGNAPNLSFRGGSFANQSVNLIPSTDSNRAAMLRSSIFSFEGSNVTLTSVPNGRYQIYLYVWEDNNSEKVHFFLNGAPTLYDYHTGPAGTWKKLGPWTTTTSDTTIRVEAAGVANFSGIEIWREQ